MKSISEEHFLNKLFNAALLVLVTAAIGEGIWGFTHPSPNNNYSLGSFDITMQVAFFVVLFPGSFFALKFRKLLLEGAIESALIGIGAILVMPLGGWKMAPVSTYIQMAVQLMLLINAKNTWVTRKNQRSIAFLSLAVVIFSLLLRGISLYSYAY